MYRIVFHSLKLKTGLVLCTKRKKKKRKRRLIFEIHSSRPRLVTNLSWQINRRRSEKSNLHGSNVIIPPRIELNDALLRVSKDIHRRMHFSPITRENECELCRCHTKSIDRHRENFPIILSDRVLLIIIELSRIPCVYSRPQNSSWNPSNRINYHLFITNAITSSLRCSKYRHPSHSCL